MTISVRSSTPQFNVVYKERKQQGVDIITKQLAVGSENGVGKTERDSKAPIDGSRIATVESDGGVVSQMHDYGSLRPVPSSGVEVLANPTISHPNGSGYLSPEKLAKPCRTASRGRRKSEDQKKYNRKSQGNGQTRQRKMSKTSRDYENSSSNGGNSGADGNGEDNGSDDDEDDEDMEDDEDDEEDDDDDEEGEDEEDEEEEEDDEGSLNGNEKNGKVEMKIKEEPTEQEILPSGPQGLIPGMSENVPLVELLDKIPNSVSTGDENSLSTTLPGTPVTLHGIVCHETGGVLVVNIKWRNKFYCGSLIDCSRHAWASPRFPAADGGETETKVGGKGGKGKRRPKGCAISSVGVVTKEATPLKQKLRGRKRGVSGCPPPKSQVFKVLGKRRSKNMDIDGDEGGRPGKRTCTVKSTVSPQPSPTLIECPEPGCDKKYKHINGLRYHQAHAHLEESNQSDERSASTSPSPVEEFKEPDMKTSSKGRTSRVSARARSVSPSLAAAIATINEKKNDLSSKGFGVKKKEAADQPFDGAMMKPGHKKIKCLTSANDEEGNGDEPMEVKVESSDKCQQACENEILQEKDQIMCAESISSFRDKEKDFEESPCIKSKDTAVDTLQEGNSLLLSLSSSSNSHGDDVAMATAAEILPQEESSAKIETVDDNLEVWETVIDSGFSGMAECGEKSFDSEDTVSLGQVEEMEKVMSEKDAGVKPCKSHPELPAVKPVDLRQAVDTGMGLINQLGIEVEDISENEEDIDPGQDSQYNNKGLAFFPSESTDAETNSDIKDTMNIPGHAGNLYLTTTKTVDMEPRKGHSKRAVINADEPKAIVEDSKVDFFSGNKNSPSSEGKHDQKMFEKNLPADKDKGQELWTTQAKVSVSSTGLEESKGGKLESLDRNADKNTSGNISVEELVSKSISRSAIEPPLTNRDTPSMRFKYFMCRNYGDENYDQCIRESDGECKATNESTATLAPIRHPDLVRNGSLGRSPTDLCGSSVMSHTAHSSDSQGANPKLVSTIGKDTFGSHGSEHLTDSKIITNKLAPEKSDSRTRIPNMKALQRNSKFLDGRGVVVASEHSVSSPSAASSTGYTKALISSLDTGLTGESSEELPFSIVDTRGIAKAAGQCSPFHPIIVEHDFQPAEATPGIRQEVDVMLSSHTDTRTSAVPSVSRTSADRSKSTAELQGTLVDESAVSKRTIQQNSIIEEYEQPYKAAARTLSRAPPTLISRHTHSLPPSLPVGVAHPYHRATNKVSTTGPLKTCDNTTVPTMSSATTVTYSRSSPRLLSSTHEVAMNDQQLELENKGKQVKTLQVPKVQEIPVGEVSPVSLKRSPGPAIHVGLPPVMHIGPGVKTQGSVLSHSSTRHSLSASSIGKVSGMSDQVRTDRKSDSSMREQLPQSHSRSPVPIPLSGTKILHDSEPPQKPSVSTGTTKKGRALENENADSEVIVIKQEPATFAFSKDKPRVIKEKERRDDRDGASDMNFRSQEPLSAEQLRNLQLQQQLNLHQYYQPLIQGGMSLEVLKNLNQFIDPNASLAAQLQLLQNMQPEQQLQLHRQRLLEQDREAFKTITSNTGSIETRNMDKREVTKPVDRLWDERQGNEPGSAKKSSQDRVHFSTTESEFRRFPSSSESARYSSTSSSPQVIHKLSQDEPPEKKSKVDTDLYERELQRQKYKHQEEYLQKQKLQQTISMYKQLESEQQNKQLPHKRQLAFEGYERIKSKRDEDGLESRGSARELIHYKPREASARGSRNTPYSLDMDKSAISSLGQSSPRDSITKSQSLLARRSPRPSRSPGPSSRHVDSSPGSEETRDRASQLTPNFMPTQFQAYLQAQGQMLSQLNFDHSAGSVLYGAPQMLVAPQFPLPGGLVMSMPMASSGESSTVTSTPSIYRGAERERTSTSTSLSSTNSQSSSTESHERLQRLKESQRSPAILQEDRVRGRSVSDEQGSSSKSNSRALDSKGEDSSIHSHPSIISTNLAVRRGDVSRLPGHMEVLSEEDMMRRQRYSMEYSDPSQALRLGYYVHPAGLMGHFDPAYAGMVPPSSQHNVRGMEHFMTKRQ